MAERSGRRRDDGTATAELAVAMPAVVVALTAVLAAGQAVVAQVRCVDAARAGARAAARGDAPGEVRRLALDGVPGTTVRLGGGGGGGGGTVTVDVSRRLPLLLPRGPVVRLHARAVATREQPAPDAGSATILLVGVLLVGLLLAGAASVLGAAVVARHRAQAAADLGALAGAAVLDGVGARGVGGRGVGASGVGPRGVGGRGAGDPCAAASRIVRANGARLQQCSTSSGDLLVIVTVRPAGPAAAAGVARARARAGPAVGAP